MEAAMRYTNGDQAQAASHIVPRPDAHAESVQAGNTEVASTGKQTRRRGRKWRGNKKQELPKQDSSNVSEKHTEPHINHDFTTDAAMSSAAPSVPTERTVADDVDVLTSNLQNTSLGHQNFIPYTGPHSFEVRKVAQQAQHEEARRWLRRMDMMTGRIPPTQTYTLEPRPFPSAPLTQHPTFDTAWNPFDPHAYRSQQSWRNQTEQLRGYEPEPDACHTERSKRSLGAFRRSISPRSLGRSWPKMPLPSPSYLQAATQLPQETNDPQPLLIVSDLNGTLILRKKQSGIFQTRPTLSDFLEFLRSSLTANRDLTGWHHRFMIWTSSQPHTVSKIVPRLLTPAERENTVAMWARDRLGLTSEQYQGKVPSYKDLRTIWSDETIQRTHPFYNWGGRWNQTNTLLLDDSAYKASAQPYNFVEVPELTAESFKRESRQGNGVPISVLAQVAWYIQDASMHLDVSAFVRTRPFIIDSDWGIGDEGGVSKEHFAFAAGSTAEEAIDLTEESDIDKVKGADTAKAAYSLWEADGPMNAQTLKDIQTPAARYSEEGVVDLTQDED